ncbi:hypothetical protein ABW19_dt0201901 [Dactylella cylindrospora]|nr:hypothetical protein ABW19_dt0201901 [Dactylella cylindrospora]
MSLEEANRLCNESMNDQRAIASSRAPDGSPDSCVVTACFGGRDAYVDPVDEKIKCCATGLKWNYNDEASLGQCCAAGQTLSVNVEVKQGACCGAGHSFFYDAVVQKGICCPSDSEGYSNGECQPWKGPPVPPTPDCHEKPQGFYPCDDCHGVEVCPNSISMGMQYGRCYQFTDPKRGTLGRYLNEYQMGGIMQGVHFKLCKSTTDCSIGEELKAGQSFYLQDMIGDVNDVLGKPAWMNTAANLAHKQVTTNAAAAAQLSAKPGCFADGCLLCLHGTGALQGFGMACPSPQSGVSQFQNPNICLPLKVQQVRCNDDKSVNGAWIYKNKGVAVNERAPRVEL